jgi:hypothetical protein
MSQDSREDLELRLSATTALGSEGERLSIEGAKLRGIDWPKADLDNVRARLVRTSFDSGTTGRRSRDYVVVAAEE